MPLTLEDWDALEQTEREEAACALELPVDVEFVGLESHQQGAARHQVAFFRGAGGRFAFVPGGPAKLGYDGAFTPTEQQRAEYESAVEAFGLPPRLEQWLAYALSARRRLSMASLLVEERATPIGTGWMAPSGSSEAFDEAPGWIQAKNAARRMRLEEVISELRRAGFRVPSRDEWEYFCRGGTTSLFRWGDDIPAGTPPRGPGDTDVDDDVARPNALGLHIARNPYDLEVVEGGHLAGGDGGSAACGGMGSLFEWLSLASAFRLDELTLRPTDVLSGELVRRVVTVARPPWVGGLGLHGEGVAIDSNMLEALLDEWCLQQCTVLCLEAPNGSTLTAWADGPHVLVEHTDADERIHHAHDPDAGDAPIAFTRYQGDTAEAPRSAFLSREAAAEVLRAFFASEELPMTVEWVLGFEPTS